MPGFKDFVNLATLLETDMDDLVMKQTVMKFASAAARTAALTGFFREGLISYLDDTNTLAVNTGATDVWNQIGPVHGALTTWTPTVTQLGSVTVTNTYSRYIRVGRLVTGWFNVSVTGSGTGANAVIVVPPLTAASPNVSVGVAEITDVSAGLKHFGRLYLGSTSTLDFRNAISGGAPADNRLGINGFVAGLASGDIIEGSFRYEISADG